MSWVRVRSDADGSKCSGHGVRNVDRSGREDLDSAKAKKVVLG